MQNKSFTPDVAGAFIALCFIWGTTFLGIKIEIGYLPPFLFSGFRHLAAGLILTSVSLIRGAKLPGRGELQKIFLFGCVFIVGGNGLIAISEKYLSSGFTAVMSALTPMYVAALSFFLLKGTKISWAVAAGMTISFLGVLILSYPNVQERWDAVFLKGFCLIFFANLCWSLGSVVMKKADLKSDVFLGLGLQMLAGGGISLLLSFFFEERISYKPLDFRFFTTFAYLILIGSIGGYGCYFYLLKKMAPVRVSLYSYVSTAVAVLAGWLILGEKVTLNSLLAMGVILAGVVVVNYEFGRINTTAK